MTPLPGRDPLADASHDAELAAALLQFAAAECEPGQLYDTLCRIAADEPQLKRTLLVAAPEQRRANLLLAALHDLVLAGDAPALAAYYPSVGGARGVDAALRSTLLDLAESRRDALLQRIATRTTQTNEIGRCAVLWPVLRQVAADCANPRLALLDFGCSAGLNLGVDAYRYDYGELSLGADEAPGVPTVQCRLVGPNRPAAGAPPQVVQRLGIDPAPIAVDDDEAVRWLRACLWPHDAVRRERFDQAVRLARRLRWPVRRAADCSLAIEPWLDGLPAGLQPVVFNSWVLTYLPAAALAAHVARMQRLVQERGVVWISAEWPALRIGDAEPPPELRSGTPWTVVTPAGESPRYEVLASSHPHGSWMKWHRQ